MDHTAQPSLPPPTPPSPGTTTDPNAAATGSAGVGEPGASGGAIPSDTSGEPTLDRPGRVTTTWRILLGLAWAAGFFAYAAVWQASVQLGIGTWWIGPRAQPAPGVLRLLPFLVCLAMILGVVYGLRHLPRVGIALSVGLLAFAVPDLSRSVSLALAELLVAGLLLAVNAAAMTGLIRRPLETAGESARDAH